MYRKLNKILENCDAIIINSPHNLRYFSGFSGGEGILLITKEERFLFTDSRYTEAAENEARDFSVKEGGFKLCGETAKKLCLKKIAFEDKYMTVSDFSRLKKLFDAEFHGKSEEIEIIRAVKEPFEIELIKEAEHIGDLAFSHILGYIKEGVSENDIAAELEYFMRKCGAQKTSFDTITISGRKTSIPHGQPSDKKIKNGEFITMDFGCIFKGYCSDMTRTVVLGKASEEQKKIYNIVKSAQEAGLNAIKAGVSGSEADKAARDIIDFEGYGKYFGHSLGHGVGLLIHEMPTLSPNYNGILKENMVVSCEPGIYIPGKFGVRIEDLVLVTAEKPVIFSKSSKELTEI